MSFATDRPVFNIPDGFRVEIDEARIINNRYFAPETPMPGVVPLPAAAWGLMTGLLALFALRRRRNV